MLKPVMNTENELVFRNISPDSSGQGVCYVCDGQHRFDRRERPFIVLYLQDVTGTVIPGYIFNVENFKGAGKDLSKVIHSMVVIDDLCGTVDPPVEAEVIPEEQDQKAPSEDESKFQRQRPSRQPS